MAVAKQRTVIVVTHSLRIVSAATRVYHVTGNGDVAHGPAAEMVPRLFGVRRPAAANERPAAAKDSASAASTLA